MPAIRLFRSHASFQRAVQVIDENIDSARLRAALRSTLACLWRLGWRGGLIRGKNNNYLAKATDLGWRAWIRQKKHLVSLGLLTIDRSGMPSGNTLIYRLVVPGLPRGGAVVRGVVRAVSKTCFHDTGNESLRTRGAQSSAHAPPVSSSAPSSSPSDPNRPKPVDPAVFAKGWAKVKASIVPPQQPSTLRRAIEHPRP
jgi:hypothetical protein